MNTIPTGAEPAEEQRRDSGAGADGELVDELQDDPRDDLPDALVLETARRIIASDAAIIHRLGTI
ncbi:hypothetical protein Caci_0585 [Catenulispora acidiphila DSM 44928]|uniref:Uncharacterized protein n=1 Tax=Catenulispora acidiphila (strain DSM 44928 / JCM 14897 / NBRC 102108 / NRRL B-24433 / ID139908) TaxID=479433 RepID=C7PYW6_CATAD|nr:hypothetical protein [Catenulispora acidiphila]ACU69522.1 hypothetical protein Caci_0585 [Catenulispora acidiphila DSM 44928]